jgi:hypothetical protein
MNRGLKTVVAQARRFGSVGVSKNAAPSTTTRIRTDQVRTLVATKQVFSSVYQVQGT